ncbi:hypothetical protein ACRAWD_29765 [Caulobacter segnis]
MPFISADRGLHAAVPGRRLGFYGSATGAVKSHRAAHRGDDGRGMRAMAPIWCLLRTTSWRCSPGRCFQNG